MRQTVTMFAAMTLAAAPLAAQFDASGLGGVGTIDGTWTVSWTATPLGGSGTSGGAYGAYTVNPAAPWQPNQGVGLTNWISAWRNATASNGVGDYNRITNGGHRYTYTFRQDFTSTGAGTMQFIAGWDNLFQSFTLNGTSYTPASLLVSATDRGVNDHFGFCRNGDAIFDSADMPNCVATFQANGVVAGNNWVEIVLRGDGLTDGLWIEGSLPAGPTEVVPEPATMGLLATGLAGMMGAQLRRRRRNTGD